MDETVISGYSIDVLFYRSRVLSCKIFKAVAKNIPKFPWENLWQDPFSEKLQALVIIGISSKCVWVCYESRANILKFLVFIFNYFIAKVPSFCCYSISIAEF